MAFHLFKLISSETLIADSYHITSIKKYLIDSKNDNEIDNPLFSGNDVFILIEPVEIIKRIDNLGNSETSLDLYLPYTDEKVIPLPQSRVITMTIPNSSMLEAYNSYIQSLRQKQRAKDKIIQKGFGDAEELVHMLFDLDEVKSTKH